MLSPVPLNPVDYGAVPNSPVQLLISPLKIPFQSPGFGRTPGAYVVQEGRLSLEMFDFAETNLTSPGIHPGLDLLAPMDGAAQGKSTQVLQKTSSTAQQIENFAPLFSGQAQPQKINTTSIYNATAEQVAAAAAHASKMLESLPDKLEAQVRQTMTDAKGDVGLQAFDSSRIEAHLRASLLEQAAPPFASPSYGAPPNEYRTYDAKPADPRPQSAAPPADEPAASQHRVRRKRARFEDSDYEYEEADELPPRKRLDRMNALYDELRQAHQRNLSLDRAVYQVHKHVTEELRNNEILWAMSAHIGAAMHMAVEERDLNAQEQLKTSLYEEDEKEEEEAEVVEAKAPVAVAAEQTTARPGLSPGAAMFAAIFSPDGSDLFAACNMFVSPTDRAVQAEDPVEKPRELFPEDARQAPVVDAQAPVEKQAVPLNTEDSFSF